MPSREKEISDSVDAWFASDEYKAIRLWQNRQGEIIDRVSKLTRTCKNEYDVELHYNSEKQWFTGNCYYCCELHSVCKKGKRKEVYEEPTHPLLEKREK